MFSVIDKKGIAAFIAIGAISAVAVVATSGGKCYRVSALRADGSYENIDIKEDEMIPDDVTPIAGSTQEASCGILRPGIERRPLDLGECLVGDVMHPPAIAYKGRCCESGCRCVGVCKPALPVEIAGHEIGIDRELVH